MDDFATFHTQNWTRLEPELLELDTMRRHALSRIAVLAGGLAVLALGIAGLILASLAEPWLALIPLVIGILIGLAGSSWLSAGYRASFKERIVGSLVRSVNPSLHYAAKDSIAEEEFQRSRLFTQGIDRFSGEDMVQGQIGATALRFSEIHAEYKTTSRDSNGSTDTNWHTIFKGIFFIADFNKHFAGVTVVRPDTAQRLFGQLGQMLQSVGNTFSDLELVTLENPEFEEAFVVLSSDQVEARYILSTSLMERILDYRRRTGRTLALSFVASQINIGITTSRDLFEPPLFKSCANPDLIREYLEDLLMMIAIVEDLNLNLRIWSKQ